MCILPMEYPLLQESMMGRFLFFLGVPKATCLRGMSIDFGYFRFFFGSPGFQKLLTHTNFQTS